MVYRVNITSNAKDILSALEESAKTAPQRIQRAFAAESVSLQRQMLAELQVEPPSASSAYPLPWKSAKQRRFVMAKLRREGNLPYRRTHVLIKNWRVRVLLENKAAPVGEVVVENLTPYARFVIGDDAQPMFLKIGWKQGAPIIAKYRPLFEDRLIDVWGRYAL